MAKMGLNDTMHPTLGLLGRICTPLGAILGDFAPHPGRFLMILHPTLEHFTPHLLAKDCTPLSWL